MADQSVEQPEEPTKPVDLADAIRAKLRADGANRANGDQPPGHGPTGGRGKGAKRGQGGHNPKQHAFRRT